MQATTSNQITAPKRRICHGFVAAAAAVRKLGFESVVLWAAFRVNAPSRDIRSTMAHRFNQLPPQMEPWSSSRSVASLGSKCCGMRACRPANLAERRRKRSRVDVPLPSHIGLLISTSTA
eukprot:9472513-Pyramimonas_sp.AAC.1